VRLFSVSAFIASLFNIRCVTINLRGLELLEHNIKVIMEVLVVTFLNRYFTDIRNYEIIIFEAWRLILTEFNYNILTNIRTHTTCSATNKPKVGKYLYRNIRKFNEINTLGISPQFLGKVRNEICQLRGAQFIHKINTIQTTEIGLILMPWA